MADSVIRFTAAVYKVQTLSLDKGVRVTLDLPEDAIPQMAMLAEAQRQGIPLIFEVKTNVQQDVYDNNARRKRK